jgi:hypothetical protein
MEMPRLKILMIDRYLNILDTKFMLQSSRDKVVFGSQGVCDECMDSHAYAVIISGASGILHLPHISCDCTPKKT